MGKKNKHFYKDISTRDFVCHLETEIIRDWKFLWKNIQTLKKARYGGTHLSSQHPGDAGRQISMSSGLSMTLLENNQGYTVILFLIAKEVEKEEEKGAKDSNNNKRQPQNKT